VTESGPKSLKDQYRAQLWLVIALNVIVFHAVLRSGSISAQGWAGIIPSGLSLVPAGLALVVTSVANGLLDPITKARLVFLRWHDPLPGSRAFSKWAGTDPRVDPARLKRRLGKTFPSGAAAENRAWYKLYKEVEQDPAIQHTHRDFLFTRDYAALAALFLLGFTGAAIASLSDRRVAIGYGLCLTLQYLTVRRAAAVYGVRFVTTVLARAADRPPSQAK